MRQLALALTVALLIVSLSGCNVFIRQPIYSSASLDYPGLFLTSGDGDWAEYEPVAHFEYFNTGTRWWFPLGFIYVFPIERADYGAAIRDHLVPAIEDLGADGAINLSVDYVPTTWGSPVLFLFVGQSALGQRGRVLMRATIVRRDGRDGGADAPEPVEAGRSGPDER